MSRQLFYTAKTRTLFTYRWLLTGWWIKHSYCCLYFTSFMCSASCSHWEKVPAVADGPARRNRTVDRAWRSLRYTGGRARRYCQLVDDVCPLKMLWVSTFLKLSWKHVSTIDLLSKFLSPEFRKCSYFHIYLNFYYSTVKDGWKEASLPEMSSIRPSRSIEHRLETDSDRHRLSA